MDTIWFAELNSPLGKLTLESDGEALTRIRLPEEEWTPDPGAKRVRKPELFKEAAAQLGAFFRGERAEFDLKLNPGGTPFQAKAVSYTHLTLPTNRVACRSRWSPYH